MPLHKQLTENEIQDLVGNRLKTATGNVLVAYDATSNTYEITSQAGTGDVTQSYVDAADGLLQDQINQLPIFHYFPDADKSPRPVEMGKLYYSDTSGLHKYIGGFDLARYVDPDDVTGWEKVPLASGRVENWKPHTNYIWGQMAADGNVVMVNQSDHQSDADLSNDLLKQYWCPINRVMPNEELINIATTTVLIQPIYYAGSCINIPANHPGFVVRLAANVATFNTRDSPPGATFELTFKNFRPAVVSFDSSYFEEVPNLAGMSGTLTIRMVVVAGRKLRVLSVTKPQPMAGTIGTSISDKQVTSRNLDGVIHGYDTIDGYNAAATIDFNLQALSLNTYKNFESISNDFHNQLEAFRWNGNNGQFGVNGKIILADEAKLLDLYLYANGTTKEIRSGHITLENVVLSDMTLTSTGDVTLNNCEVVFDSTVAYFITSPTPLTGNDKKRVYLQGNTSFVNVQNIADSSFIVVDQRVTATSTGGITSASLAISGQTLTLNTSAGNSSVTLPTATGSGGETVSSLSHVIDLVGYHYNSIPITQAQHYLLPGTNFVWDNSYAIGKQVYLEVVGKGSQSGSRSNYPIAVLYTEAGVTVSGASIAGGFGAVVGRNRSQAIQLTHGVTYVIWVGTNSQSSDFQPCALYSVRLIIM